MNHEEEMKRLCDAGDFETAMDIAYDYLAGCSVDPTAHYDELSATVGNFRLFGRWEYRGGEGIVTDAAFIWELEENGDYCLEGPLEGEVFQELVDELAYEMGRPY